MLDADLTGWLNCNKILLNVSKAETILFRNPRKKIYYDVRLRLSDKDLTFVKETNYLGINLDQHLNWKAQIDKLSKKLGKTNGIISKDILFLRKLAY